MIDNIRNLGYHNVLSHTIHQNILCAYPKPKMEEIQEKVRTVLSLFRDISAEVSKLDSMMEFTPYISGSCIEGTKVVKPDELDVLCVLHNFRDLSFIDGNKVPFVEIRRRTSNKYHPCYREKDLVIEPMLVRKHFYFLFSKALHNTAVWKKYPKLLKLTAYRDMFVYTESIAKFHLAWCGEHFPLLIFGVDVVPAVSTNGWLPVCISKHRLPQKYGCLTIPKYKDQFYMSLERSESALFSVMPDALKQAYMLAKIVCNKCRHGREYSASRDGAIIIPTSYILKTLTFHIFRYHEEYEKRVMQLL